MRRTSLLPLARAGLACAFVGSAFAATRGEWRPLPAALAPRRLRVAPDAIRWLDPPSLGARRALIIANAPGQPSDVYAVTAHTGDDDRVVRIDDVSNLTRSPNADESDLVANGAFAAFATRVAGSVVAVSVIDTRGDHSSAPGDRGARLRAALTRWQQTGRVRGYGIDRFELQSPAPVVSLNLVGTQLDVSIPERPRVSIDLARARIVSGASQVRERPRLSATSDNWITWAVDTVRALPWVGTAPIAWVEGVAFRARHVAHRASAVVASADSTQRAVAEDLADVLAIRSGDAVEGRVEDWPPRALVAPIQPALAHEGEWSPIGHDNDPFAPTNPGAPTPMLITFVRTDRDADASRAYVVAWDPRQIELHVAPGSQEPMGATGETGSGVIPRDEPTMLRLVAGFNGAFQGLHGEFGVFAEGALLLPPKPYAATVVALADGNTGFGSWPATQRDIPTDVLEFRQNLTALIDGGEFNPWHRDDWGPVLGNPADARTARSGLCMTREGYVAFFWGNDLSPRGLADAMLATRCSYGMHLDMNGANTGFDFYRVDRRGAAPRLDHRITAGFEAEGPVDELPGLVFRARRMVRGMQHQASRYIHRNARDFFYLLLRPVLPGPPIAPRVAPAAPGEGTWHVAGLSDDVFPWPIARTRIRPDAAQPERWVNLVRLDARRIALAPRDATGNVVARVTDVIAALAPGGLRISMTQGIAGPHWSIGNEGTGIAAEPLIAGQSTVRGACVDANGFLVLAVADRAVPDLITHALDAAGCTGARVALRGGVLVLPSGRTVAGESDAPPGEPVFALVAREFPRARAMFPEVTAVPRAVWSPEQSRRVRYFPNPGNNVTVQVRLAGQQPTVFRLPGLGPRFFTTAYPDGGLPPEMPGGGN